MLQGPVWKNEVNSHQLSVSGLWIRLYAYSVLEHHAKCPNHLSSPQRAEHKSFHFTIRSSRINIGGNKSPEMKYLAWFGEGSEVRWKISVLFLLRSSCHHICRKVDEAGYGFTDNPPHFITVNMLSEWEPASLHSEYREKISHKVLQKIAKD